MKGEYFYSIWCHKVILPILPKKKFEPKLIKTKKNVFITRKRKKGKLKMNDWLKINPYLKKSNNHFHRVYFKIFNANYYLLWNQFLINNDNEYKFIINNNYTYNFNQIRINKIDRYKYINPYRIYKKRNFYYIPFSKNYAIKLINGKFKLNYNKNEYRKLYRNNWKEFSLEIYNKNNYPSINYNNIYNSNYYKNLNINNFYLERNLKYLPKVKPSNKSYKIRFPYTFYNKKFRIEFNLIKLILENKKYIYILLYLIKYYPEKLNITWDKYELINIIFSNLPKNYWSHIQHWVPYNINYNDPIYNIYNLAKAKRYTKNINYRIIHKKKNRAKVTSIKYNMYHYNKNLFYKWFIQ